VKGRGGSKVLEWNPLQRIDAIEKKYPDCGDVSGNLGDTLEKLETGSLVSSGNLPNKCTRDIHSEMRLSDPRSGAFFR